MSMTVYRVIKDNNNPYVMVNKGPLGDTRLSWKAKGILFYLLSLPNDWKLYEQEITKHSKDGIKGTKAGIKELIQNGYIERKKVRNEKGRFTGWEYFVYEVSPTIPKTDVGNSDVRKRHTTNNNLTDNNQTEYNNDNGATPGGDCSSYFSNQDVVKAMAAYMNNLYARKTGRKHPRLKPEQYRRAYDNIAAFCGEWGIEYDALIDMMAQFLNSGIESDWNILHFATEGIMTNRMYEVAY